MCDRSYGVCQCFSGYEGSSCRTECPNDCSNPGTRMTNTLFATDAGVRYSWAWDNGKHYGCKCDRLPRRGLFLQGVVAHRVWTQECPSCTDPINDCEFESLVQLYCPAL